MKYITHDIELIRKLFYVNIDGEVIRKQGTRKQKIGTIAGYITSKDKNNYRHISINLNNTMAHRVAWVLYYGEWPDKDIDHINGNGLDNRKDNLRLACRQINSQNMSLYCTNTSGIQGVRWDASHNKWHSRIGGSKNSKHLGWFDNIFDAVCARKSAEYRYGYHDNHGR